VRRYLGRVLIVLALVTPLLVAATYQLAPRRGGRDSGDLVLAAIAASDVAEGAFGLSSRVEPTSLMDPDAATGRMTLAGQDPPNGRLGAAGMLAPGGADELKPLAWYRVAAAEHGVSPYLIEALHQIETGAAPDGCWLNIEGSGAVGPFQFKRPTFDIFGVDGNGDGVRDICGFVDSLFSAANYLRALGADNDIESPATRQALEQYGTDAERVVTLARHDRWRDGLLTATLR